ncbi:MAG: IS110 family transposase [Nitrososphaeria archaeon]
MLVNLTKVKGRLLNKSDRLDSATLATLLIINQLSPSSVQAKDLRKLRRLTKIRASLIIMKKAIKNQQYSRQHLQP